MFTLVANWIKDRKLKFTRLCRGTTSFVSILASESHQGRDMQKMVDEIKPYQVGWKAAVIAVIAKIAKSDGVVTPAKIAVAEEIFDQMELSEHGRQEAMKVFKHAKDSSMSLFHMLVGIRDMCEPDQDTITILAHSSFQMAHADGDLSPQAKDSLFTVCDVFHLSYDFYYNAYIGRREYLQVEKDAYDALGCKPSDSDDVIKDRYRILIKDFHPDRILPKELAPEFTKFAEEKFKKIQSAYEWITLRRGQR